MNATTTQGFSRRQALGASALVAGALAAWPLTALASEKQGGASDSMAAGAAASEDAAASSAVTPLNEVVYPEPIASGDYEKLLAVEEENPLDDDLLNGIDAFANNLTCYGLASGEGDVPNACLSPASLYLALGLLAQGAAGDTQVQLLDALGIGEGGAETLAGQCGNLMRVLWARTTPEGDQLPSTLQVANSVWMHAEVPFEQAFLDTAAQDFYAECFAVNEPGDEAAKEMGAWIAKHTGSTLEPTVEFDDAWITSLVNTVWFKDGWTDPFNENDTAPGTFHAGAGDVECDFMTRTRDCAVVQANGYRLASLPLATGANITFLLPDEGVDPRSFFGRAAGIGMLWQDASTSSDLAKVTFVVPKVSFDATTQLVEVCEQLGVVDAFGENADLSALTPVPAQVSSVEQGTHFAMNECGIEASAYTLIGITKMSAPLEDLEEIEFRLDRPFAFRLTDPHGIPLFVGLVGDPTQA